MQEMLDSLFALNIDRRADIAVLDLGLTQEQVSSLQTQGILVSKPTWPDYTPDLVRAIPHQIGLVARTALRDYFPGYSVYLWFDADAWAQTPEFFDALVNGAKDKGAAVIREDGPNYKRDLVYAKWWYGHMMACYGPINGMRVAMKPSINIGILALSDTAPHWEQWISYYKTFIDRRARVNNQHSFNAALELENLPYFQAPARCNWITVLSTPKWDADKQMLCEPGLMQKPLSIIHMAGPRKDAPYDMKTLQGGKITMSLTYSSIQSHKNKDFLREQKKSVV
jgi:hypothetical protein